MPGRFSAIAIAALLAGCATSPTGEHPVANNRFYPSWTPDVVMDRMLGITTVRDYYVTASDRRGGVLNLERAIATPSRSGTVFNWADCGGVSLLEQPVSQLVELSVIAEPKGTGSSVTIHTRFSEIRRDVRHGERRVNCTTTGKLEYEMLQLLGTS